MFLDDYHSACLFPNSSYAVMKAARSNMAGAVNKVKYSRLAADEDGYIDLQVRDLFFGSSANLTLAAFHFFFLLSSNLTFLTNFLL